MLLQLKDLASQKLISVPEEGLTFGREGGDAQVQVADMGVSKRHAEVFCEAGAWFLKDLGSSNGTMLANERISDATEILPGDVFQLSKRKFEVLKVVEDEGGDEPPPEDDAPMMTEPERKAPAKPAAKPAAKSAPPPTKKPAAGNMAKAGAGKPEPTRAAPDADGGGDEEIGNASVGQVIAGALKAIPYYLANVPLMLLNPLGTIRKSIEEQPRDPMGRMELIAWALPGTLFAGAVAFISTFIAAIISGSLAAIGASIMVLVIGAIVGVVVAVVMGLIWHPFTEFFVHKLFKGESDARSRTNYFLQFITVYILVRIPEGLTIILTALIARLGLNFLLIIPILVSAAANVLLLFVTYKWYEHFNVVKWVRTVLLVVMGLTALGSLFGLLGVLRGPLISSVGSTSGGGDVADVDDAQKQALEAMKAAGATAEQIKQAEAAYKASREALKNAGAAGAEAEKAMKEAAKAAEDAAKAGADAAKAGAEATKKAAEEGKKAAEEGKKAAEKASEEVKKAADEGKKAPPPPEEVKAPVEDTPKGSPAVAVPSGGGYPAWHTKFENIEKRVTDDPTVLRKPNVLKLYQDLQEKSAEADSKVRKDYKKADPKTFMHLRDAQLFDDSGSTVDDLHKALFGR